MKKDGRLEIRASLEELKKLKELQKIMGFKTIASFIRFIMSSELARMSQDNSYLKEYWVEAHSGSIDKSII